MAPRVEGLDSLLRFVDRHMKSNEEVDSSNRTAERLPLVEEVSVIFPPEPISGPGRNISASGIYFIAEQELWVKVRIGDREVDGRLVRVETHSRGRIGLAVKFDPADFE